MKKPAGSLSVTLIQSNLHWEDRQANLTMFEEKIALIKEEKEIVVLPEMFSTGFSMNPERIAETMTGFSVEWMKRVSASNKIILTGSLIIEEEGKYFNRLIWMLPNGTFGYYDKRHLFGFAKEDEHYSRGTRRLITSAKGWKFNLQVCYDLRFPVWARQTNPINSLANERRESYQGPEYDVLICVANWPERRIHSWKTLLQARAIENQCYVIGVNRTGNDGNNIYYSGDSMIVDPMGTPVYAAEDREENFTYALSSERLNEVRTKFPFLKDADEFVIGN